ncbi:hypothetical protein SIPHO054v2_p0033 [Vibrio phage 103E44.1]|nr:hypothetical protein SIPHO054v2_p0033 [Vibrio phage 103E44.1]QZI87887.1 hypothetical protein SIPHO055v2_p0032 [Vibrio phage 104E43.1]
MKVYDVSEIVYRNRYYITTHEITKSVMTNCSYRRIKKLMKKLHCFQHGDRKKATPKWTGWDIKVSYSKRKRVAYFYERRLVSKTPIDEEPKK